jgi:NADPH2:quinone reductase
MFVGFGNASGAIPPFDIPQPLAQKGSLYMTRLTLVTYAGKRADSAEDGGKTFLAGTIGQTGRLKERTAADLRSKGCRSKRTRDLESRKSRRIP